ncbi:hypothetical protein Dda_4048 [Drechslerella dactyloides]|uniref:Uncharacterized protein n=1 Tax=Drechslerella dactyloides TaxID=74499 RepID=A0AAD6IZ16_DREDA|nr:hypothetical protein Dda_4048 [Drechslerella dactyloides]
MDYYTRLNRSADDEDLAELCQKHIETHIKSTELYQTQLARLLDPLPADGVPTLTTISINSVINSLREDPSESNFETVMKHTPTALLNSIIDNQRLHYTSMLRFAEHKGWDNFKDDSRRDLWILRNEYYIRADGTDWGLLNLDDADIVFKHCSKVVKDADGKEVHRAITRKIAPKSGLQYLDQKRPRTLKIQPSTEAYRRTFNRLMHGALDGLDWNNVFVAGGMALSALLCVDEGMDAEYKDNDIDMYIYGLTPAQANEKVKHIANVWKKNLKPDEEYTMVKNAKTITLIGTYPTRRIQIIMKSIKTPASVLLNFDLDQVAIGYTGESVLFLPRCARALETGYSIFTLDMIHGHHLNDRRETQEERLFKYARRGFGVRILPEFCEMVEIDFNRRRHTQGFLDQARQAVSGAPSGHTWQRPVDNPHIKDVITGVKAVRRVFAAGEDMVHRFYIGRTEVSKPDDYGDEDDFYNDDPASRGGWAFTKVKDPETGEEKSIPKALFSSIVYDNETYDMLPKYKWDQGFTPASFVKSIDSYNEDLFQNFCEALEMDPAIHQKISPGAPTGGFYRAYSRGPSSNWKSHLRGYLTRRIRRMTYSKDINELVDRFQIVLPLSINLKLEEWIKDTFAQALEDAGLPSSSHEILIPVHKPGMGDGYLPDLSEGTEDNMRYWVIDSTTIWAGIDRRIDDQGDAGEEMYSIVASLLLRRVTKLSLQQLGVERVSGAKGPVPTGVDPVYEFIEAPTSADVNPLVIPNQRDQYLFTKWLMEQPVSIYRGYQYEIHPSYREENNNTAPPDIMYWREGIDGTGNEWTEWPEGAPGFEPIATFRPPPGRPTRSDGRSNSDDDWADELSDGDDDNAGDDDDDQSPQLGRKRRGSALAAGQMGNDRADDDDDDVDAEGEYANPGSRGTKRRREKSDLTDMAAGLDAAGSDNDDDTSMADAPGEAN